MVLHIDELPKNSKKMGLYCISESPPETKSDIKFKIGMATNLYRRLNSYNICPGLWNGFYLYGLIVIKDPSVGKPPKEARKLKFKACYGMEQLLFKTTEAKYPKAHLVELKDITGAREVFQISAENLHKLLKDFVSENSKSLSESHIFAVKSSGDRKVAPYIKPIKYEGLSVSEIEKEKKETEQDLKKFAKMEKYEVEHPRAAPTRELPKRARKPTKMYSDTGDRTSLASQLHLAEFFRHL